MASTINAWGGQLSDFSKSRNSFVMHVTPKFQLVYGQDSYFAPNKKIKSTDSNINYKLLSEQRYCRDENLWAICQKIFLSAK